MNAADMTAEQRTYAEAQLRAGTTITAIVRHLRTVKRHAVRELARLLGVVRPPGPPPGGRLGGKVDEAALRVLVAAGRNDSECARALSAAGGRSVTRQAVGQARRRWGF